MRKKINYHRHKSFSVMKKLFYFMAMPKNDAVLPEYQLKRFFLAQFKRQKCSIPLMNENKRIHRIETKIH